MIDVLQNDMYETPPVLWNMVEKIGTFFHKEGISTCLFPEY